jgi:hypothetical protein
VALLPTLFDEHGLDVESLLTGPHVVALAATDPLAARATVRLTDLAGRQLTDGTRVEVGGRNSLAAAPAPGSGGSGADVGAFIC